MLVNPAEPVVVIALLVNARAVPVAAFVLIVAISFAVAGDNVVPVLDQYPTVPLLAQVCPLIQIVP